jgi:hypothetical protein
LELLHLVVSIRERFRRSQNKVRVVREGSDRAAYAFDQTAKEAADDSAHRLLKPRPRVADPEEAIAS